MRCSIVDAMWAVLRDVPCVSGRRRQYTVQGVLGHLSCGVHGDIEQPVPCVHKEVTAMLHTIYLGGGEKRKRTGGTSLSPITH
jgi:hypothetical protein